MGQVVSNIVSSCYSSTPNEYEEDDVDERSSRSGKHDHEKIQESRFGSIQSSSTTTLSSSSVSQLHPFAVLLTTSTTTDDDDHSINLNRDDEAVHGNHVTTASIVKRLVTISDYNFVEKNSSETENDHDEAALIVLEPSAQHSQEEGILVGEKELVDQDDEHHHHNNNQDNGAKQVEVEVELVGKHEESTSTTSGAVTHPPSAAALSTLHPSVVLLTSTQSSSYGQEDCHDETAVASIVKNVTISAHCNDFVGKISANIGDDSGTPLLELATNPQPILHLPLSEQQEDIVKLLDDQDDDGHLDDQGKGEGDEGGTKEAEIEVVIEKDDIDKKKSILINSSYSTNEQNDIIMAEERVIKHYSSYHKILLVGEGDFSFSACLARYFDSAINMVATSLDSQELLWSKYSRAKQHVEELRKLGCQVLHGVDVHVMDSHPELKSLRFERIIYNFPHAGHFLRLREQQHILIAMHQTLLLGFFKNARKMLVDEGGEVHVSHRDDDPYNRWEIVKLANKAGLALKEKVEFREADYPGYNIKRGSTRRSDETFPLGYYSFTFKFIISSLH